MIRRAKNCLVVLVTLALMATISAARQEPAQLASVSGVVVDAASRQPLADARVTLLGRTVVRPKAIEVDRLGRFSFSGIAPGIYAVEATAGYHHNGHVGTTEPDRRWFFQLKAGEHRDGDVVPLIRWAQISGRVVDETGKPLVGIWVTALIPAHRSGLLIRNPGNQELTDADGNYHLDDVDGADRVVAFPQLSYPAFRAFTVPLIGYRPTFFPAATDPDGASPVVLVPGADVRGLDITMRRWPTASIRIDFPERPAIPTRLHVVLQPSWCGATMWCPITVRQAEVSGTSMTFGKVPAGSYRISYTLNDPSKAEADIIHPGFLVSSGWQHVEIGGNETSVHIGSWNELTVSGRVVSPSVTEPVRATVCLHALDESGRYCAGTEPDGTFTTPSIPRDDYTIAVGTARGKDSWPVQAVESVAVNGEDVTDRSFHLKRNAEVLVALTDRRTMLTGAVTGNADLLLQTWVVAFPADPSLWTGFGPQPRRIRKATVVDGKFTIRSLPPGDYWVAALVEDLVYDYRWQFPERLRAWVPNATRLFVADGETATIDLKLIQTRK
jgi:hypothetical protein